MILPKAATKQKAIEYLRAKMSLNKEDVVYCGDSGNDILPLTQGYFSIMVRNTIKEVQEKVVEIALTKNIEDKVYTASGYKSLNRYYVSGIIEGLIKFGFISDDYIE